MRKIMLVKGASIQQNVVPIPILASSRENLSSGLPTMRISNQSPQLQRLDRKTEISFVASLDMILSNK